jgi:serine/threonine protein kinase
VVRSELAGQSDFRRRFAREVVAARTVSGLFTAPVVDADPDAPVPWLATAYVPGLSLADTVTRHGPLPARSVLALAAGLAEGLGAIHAAGIVHRDLKPSNVLLAEDGPRIIDFGISQAAEASMLTGSGPVPDRTQRRPSGTRLAARADYPGVPFAPSDGTRPSRAHGGRRPISSADNPAHGGTPGGRVPRACAAAASHRDPATRSSGRRTAGPPPSGTSQRRGSGRSAHNCLPGCGYDSAPASVQ